MDVLSILSEELWKEKLQEMFKETGLAMSLTDGGGKILFGEGTRNPLCERIREQPDTLASFCSQTNMAMIVQAKAAKQAVVDFCEGGLIRIAIPLFDGEELIGQVTGCGLVGNPEEIDPFYIAQELNTEESIIKDLAEKVAKNPEFSLEALKDKLVSFVTPVLKK